MTDWREISERTDYQPLHNWQGNTPPAPRDYNAAEELAETILRVMRKIKREICEFFS